MVEIYIKSYYGISALNEEPSWPLSHASAELKAIEPVYEDLLDIRSMRRLSKILKMGIFAAMKCINDAKDIVLDGVISGTGLGCTGDTFAFLDNMIKREEHLLTPTAFIQSTHNTLSGTIGIMLKNHGYNMTWSQRYFSFYKALEDAMTLIHQKAGYNYLVTGADEMPEPVAAIVNKIEGCKDYLFWTEGAGAFILGTENDNLNIRLDSIEIRKTSETDQGHLRSLLDPETLIINVNRHLNGLFLSNQILNLGENIGKIFVNDAIAIAYACSLLDIRKTNSKDFPYKKILCLGGDIKNTSMVTLSKIN